MISSTDDYDTLFKTLLTIITTREVIIQIRNIFQEYTRLSICYK